MEKKPSSNRSTLAITSIILTIIGVMITATTSIEVGLTLIFIAALFMAGSFIYRRLKSIGADVWAVGSLLVWFGYFLFSLPVFAFAWGLMGAQNRLILFISGISLMILGYFTEFFDLNMKLMELIIKSKIKLFFILNRIRNNVYSILRLTITIVSTIALTVSYSNPTFIAQLLSDNMLYNRIGLFVIIVALLTIEFWDLVLLILSTSIRIISLLLQGLLRRLKLLPSLIKSLTHAIRKLSLRITFYLKRFLILSFRNPFIIGLIGGVWFMFFGYYEDDQFTISIGILSLFIALMISIKQHPQAIVDRVNSVQQKTYLQSLKFRNRFKRKIDFACPVCKQPIKTSISFCIYCNFKFETCIVCRTIIRPDELIVNCPHCEQLAHPDHITNWVKIKAQCPNCREGWRLSEIINVRKMIYIPPKEENTNSV